MAARWRSWVIFLNTLLSSFWGNFCQKQWSKWCFLGLSDMRNLISTCIWFSDSRQGALFCNFLKNIHRIAPNFVSGGFWVQGIHFWCPFSSMIHRRGRVRSSACHHMLCLKDKKRRISLRGCSWLCSQSYFGFVPRQIVANNCDIPINE